MNSYQQQQEFEQQERMSSRQYIFENPLLPSPVISPATVYPSSDRQQQWNTQQQHDDYPQQDSQPSYSDPQQSPYAQSYAQSYTLEQHYQASPYDNSYYQSHQSSAYPYHSQSGHAHNDHYANPPVVAKVSQFSCLSGALEEPVLQHPRPSYSGSSYSSLIANVDYSRQQSSWSQYQTHTGDSREHSSSNANELPPPSYPQTDYNVQESASISYSTETGTSYDNYNNQSMAEGSIYINHQPDHAQSYHYVSQTSYVQPSNQMSSYSYQEPAGASQAAYTIPQPMLPPSQTGPRRQYAVPPAIVPTQQRAATPPPSDEDSPSASAAASPTNTVHSDRTLPIRKASITSAASIKQEEPLSRPSLIVKSSLVRSASLLHVDVGQASLDSPTSHRARQERRKAQSRNSSAPYPPTSVDMGQGHKIPTSVSPSITSPSSSAQPLVISLTERKPITMPEYVPASSSATSAASSSASGQHQVIAISGTPEPGQESPKILEGESGESSPNGGKSSNVTKVIQLDENGEKKPFLACGFCRHRKIACGQGPVWENDDQLPPGPRTCNQCFRRCLECFYPTESRRGLRKGKPSRKIVYDESGESVSFVAGEEGAVIEGSSGGDTLTVEEEDGTTKKKGKGKAKKSWKDFTCDMVRAVDADWVLARR